MIKKYFRHYALIGLIFYSTTMLVFNSFGQSMTRPRGIGLRGGFWKAKNEESMRRSHQTSPLIIVDFSVASGSLYFFSRLKENLFLETSISALGKVFLEYDSQDAVTEVSAIVPFLCGIRYDLSLSKVGSAFQPYAGSGLGPYLISEHLTVNSSGSDEVDLKFGLYVGVGMNVAIQSWFAFNCDMRYHFINLQAGEDYSGFQFCVGFCHMWGRRQNMFRLDEIKVVVNDIYPAYHQFYNTYPLALVTIKNIVNYPIEVNVRSDIQGYSERSQESGFIRIDRGETKDIPVKVLFGPKLMQASRHEQAVVEIELEARARETQTISATAQVMIHDRNAWNGEIDKLGFFVTPDDEVILSFSRDVVKEVFDLYGEESGDFFLAKALFDELKNRGIGYRRDPNIPFDKDNQVQFASETIGSGVGDCDDLLVLYSALLESTGIQTAFVEVRDPEKEIAHVYLMFDSGLSAEASGLISSNEKRFVIRESVSGKRMVWIPVETTLVEDGFEEAWKAGALQYLQEGVLRHGLAEGWMRIVDVE